MSGEDEDNFAQEVQEASPKPHDPAAVSRVFHGGAGLACVAEGSLQRVQSMVDCMQASGRERRRSRCRAAVEDMVADGKQTEPVIPLAKFERLAQDTLKELLEQTPGTVVSRLGRDAVLALQVAAEAALELLMADALTMCEHRNRQTVHVQDMRAVILFRQRWGDPLYIPARTADEDEDDNQPAPSAPPARIVDKKEFWRKDCMPEQPTAISGSHRVES